MADELCLPNLITLTDHAGDLAFYTDKLYSVFVTDLVNSKLSLFGKPVLVSSKIDADGRLERFWHTITDPHNPLMTDIKLQRAEKISWIKPILQNIEHTEVLYYNKIKHREKRLFVLVPKKDYLIILSDKTNAYYFITAYHIDYSYKKEEYLREYKKYKA